MLTKNKKQNSESEKETLFQEIMKKKLIKPKAKELPDFKDDDFVPTNPKTSATGGRK